MRHEVYKLTYASFCTDVVVPLVPLIGLMAIPIGFADMHMDSSALTTAGKMRISFGVIGQFIWLVVLLILAA